jgi:hypothetical protein
VDHFTGIRSRPTNRRIFLIGSGTVIRGGILAACGASKPSATAKTTTTTAAASGGSAPALTGDLAVASLAAQLENLGVFAYKAGLSAAGAGKLGKVPAAVGTFAMTAMTAMTAMSQHQDHADSWNAVLAANNVAKDTITDPKLTPTVQQMFSQVTDVTGLAELALLIENIAAQTYQVQTAMLPSTKAIANSASIMPLRCSTRPFCTTSWASTQAFRMQAAILWRSTRLPWRPRNSELPARAGRDRRGWVGSS